MELKLWKILKKLYKGIIGILKELKMCVMMNFQKVQNF